MFTNQSFGLEGRIARWFKDHDGAVDVYYRYGGYEAKLCTQRLGLRRYRISVLVRFTCAKY
jgi:hypothetical protein